MTPRFAPLPQSLGTVFSRSDAQSLGVSSRRLRCADVERIASGLYRRHDSSATSKPTTLPSPIASHPTESWRIEHLARLLDCGDHLPQHSFVIGRSASVLWELPLIGQTPHDHAIEIGRFAPRRSPERFGFRARQLSHDMVGVTTRFGVPVSDAATTWAMVAPALDLFGAVALGDAVIRRPRIPGTTRLERAPHATLEEVQTAASVPRRRGAPLLRRALPLLVTASASTPESHLRLLLQQWGAPAPTLDHDVFDDRGVLIGCSELAFPTIRLALEYEGDHHRIRAEQWNRDIEKYRRYRQEHWEVIRVTSELLYRRRAELRAQVFEAFERLGLPHR